MSEFETPDPQFDAPQGMPHDYTVHPRPGDHVPQPQNVTPRSRTSGRTDTHLSRSSGTYTLRSLIEQSAPILAALPGALFVHDLDGRIVHLNAAACTLLGVPPDDVSNTSISLRTPAERLSAFRVRVPGGTEVPEEEAIVTRVLRGEVIPEAHAVTYLVTAADGREVYLSLSGSPIRDGNGHIQGALIVGRDLSEQHESEVRQAATLRALEAQSAQFYTLLDLLPAGVAVYNTNGELIELNAAGRRLTQQRVLPGEPAPERQARFGMRHADGSPMPEEESPSGRARRGLRFTDVECIIDGIHGPETHVLTSGAPLPTLLANESAATTPPTAPPTTDPTSSSSVPIDTSDPSHATSPAYGSIVIFQDVTEVRRLERMAREQADLAEGIIDSSPFGIALIDASDDFRCLRHNAPYLDLVGADLRARGSVVGVGIDEFYDAESAVRTRAIFEHVRDTGGSFFVDEYEAVLPPDPTPRYYRWSLRALHDAHGKTVALVGAAVEITREVRSRREAEESARRLQTVLDVLPVAVAVVDANGGVLHVNDAFRHFWEGEEGEVPLTESIAGYGAYVGWWPDGRPIAPEEWAMARALVRGEPVTGDEIEVQTFAGHRKSIINNAAPILDEEGRVTGGVVAFLDITSRRQLEARTHEALDALLALASVLVSGHTAHAAPSDEMGAESQNADADEVRDEATDEATDKDAATPLESMMRQVAALAARTLGCERVAIATVNPTSDEMTPVALLGFLPEQEARWWQEWKLGCTVAERMGADVAAQLRLGEVVRIDLEDPRARKRLRHYALRHLLVAPMRVQGQLVGMLAFDDAGAGIEFTQRDEALAGAVGQLAALVVERDRLLREHAEADARVLALSETNRLMNEFLGIAGHELRTPLTSMRVNAQLAQLSAARAQSDTHLTPELTAALARIVNVTERIELQSRRQERLVNDLLDVSRLDAGRLELHTRPVDLGALAREAVEEQCLLHPERSVSLHISSWTPEQNDADSSEARHGGADETTHGHTVIADPDRVSQVITNYLTNALKYSPADTPVVVRVRREGSQVYLSVRDFGPGIPLREQETVWQRFQRVQGIEVQSGSGIGLGLGLFICRELIERHGGSVALRSEPGDGSEFSFSLPLIAPDAPESTARD